METTRFRLPAVEDDLWHQVVMRLLAQRDITAQRAANPLRLLEEWAFHRVVCGQRKVTRRWLERVAEWLVHTEPRRGSVTAVSQWIDALEAWDVIHSDADGNYEFTIPMLDEYFAARHLATRWAEADEQYQTWLPGWEGWWEQGGGLGCPNSRCCTLLPPFRDVLQQTEYAETLLCLSAW